MHHVEIILKVAERCNLNCTYCYFFNKENKDYENDPALISSDTVRHLVRFLRTSSQEISETVFRIDLHGGEPLLLGPRRLSEMLSIIRTGLHDAKEVNFALQTNAVLINQTWLDVFSRHMVHVGISVDGPKEQHDSNRIDRRGRGSFDSMVPKIAAVRQAVSEGSVASFGAICVINAESDAKATYTCLTKELGFSKLLFLLPDDTHDSVNPAHIGRFVTFIDELFECWKSDERKTVQIQLFDRTLQGILHNKLEADGSRELTRVAENITFTVSSAGDIGHDDTLRNVVPGLYRSGMNVVDAEFPEFLAWFRRISEILAPPRIPPACVPCSWNAICQHVTKSDTLLYKMKDRIADQPSIYCEVWKRTYLKSATYLATRGVSVREISKNLTCINSEVSL